MNTEINVLMTTYNVENYVRQAICSVLEQETPCFFNLIIVDDCSTDATLTIIDEIIHYHPRGNLVDLHCNTENLGVIKNSRKIIKLANAPYIALIDGDDYWIDKGKLQKQYDFLEKNKEFNSACSLVERHYVETNIKRIFIDGWHLSKKEIYTIRDYLISPFSQTSSYFFRNNFELPVWFDSLQSNDATIFCVATGKGKIKYFKQTFSIYRINPTNYSSKKTPKKSNEKTHFYLNKIDEYFNFKYHNTIKVRLIINDVYYFFIDGKSKFSSIIGKAIVAVLFFINKYFVKN